MTLDSGRNLIFKEEWRGGHLMPSVGLCLSMHLQAHTQASRMYMCTHTCTHAYTSITHSQTHIHTHSYTLQFVSSSFDILIYSYNILSINTSNCNLLIAYLKLLSCKLSDNFLYSLSFHLKISFLICSNQSSYFRTQF